MKNAPLIVAVVALVIAIWAWMKADSVATRIEEFGLRPHNVGR